ncbi:MAG: ATP phosphoribosyltransferase regulatory subunit [Nitrospirae bacterium]|nr:MAG: ATP phosphoribosyltransferase regulatory subunit [Nitrospirota bacterium]
MARRVFSRTETSDQPSRRLSKALIPSGMATLLPEAAQRVRLLEQAMFENFIKWGYQEIIPPTFEYFDVLAAGLSSKALETCYKFADWSTGRILVLRPDVTAQIARMVAMGLAGQTLPIRLCYRTTVFRSEPVHAGREREIFQVGAELIGSDTPVMDAEILALLLELLRGLGLEAFKVSLGHVGFYQALLEKSGLSAQGQQQAKMAAAHKDLPKLEAILRAEGIDSKIAHTILETPDRYGREEVLSWGRRVAGNNRALIEPIERLDMVYHLLKQAGFQDHLLIDLGEFRGFEYYDGLVFDVFAEGLGCELGGGGRYNHLIGRFGRDLPSTGFALDVDRLFRARQALVTQEQNDLPPVLVVSSIAQYGVAFKVSQLLRAQGLTVLQEQGATHGAAHRERLRHRARQAGIPAVICLAAKASPQTFVLNATDENSWERSPYLAVHELPSWLHRHVYARS